MITHLGTSLISQKEDTESNLSTLSSAMTNSIQASSAPAPVATDWLGRTCLGRTSLKWSAWLRWTSR